LQPEAGVAGDNDGHAVTSLSIAPRPSTSGPDAWTRYAGCAALYEKCDSVNEDVRSEETFDHIEQAWVDGNPMRYRQHTLRFDAFVGIER
jgi:hypothetical protein